MTFWYIVDLEGKTIMRSLIFGAILLFAVINGNAALGRFGPYSQGASNDIDIDLLYFGGELIPGEMNKNSYKL